jgi:hypothetical protein
VRSPSGSACEWNVRYDYSGYGLSTGKPTAGNCLADAEAAFARLRTHYAEQSKTIILYGQSLGTGPRSVSVRPSCPSCHMLPLGFTAGLRGFVLCSLYLGSRYSVDGIVIHSGLMSAVRVIQNLDYTAWYHFSTFPDVHRLGALLTTLCRVHVAGSTFSPTLTWSRRRRRPCSCCTAPRTRRSPSCTGSVLVLASYVHFSTVFIAHVCSRVADGHCRCCADSLPAMV